MNASVLYMPSFVRQYKKLEVDVQRDVKAAIERWRHNHRDPSLNILALKGVLKGCLSMSVNFRYRIILEDRGGGTIVLLKVGDHAVYR